MTTQLPALPHFTKLIPPGQKPFFLCLEGGDGVGKTTQIKALTNCFQAQGYDVVLTREPGGSPTGMEIRKLFVEGDPHRWDGISETMLIYTSRHENLRRVVRPALSANKIVIADRFALSTYAYQGVGRGVDMGFINAIHHTIVGTTNPDLTVVLDLPTDKALARSNRQGNHENRFEKLGQDFHERLRQGYLNVGNFPQFAPSSQIINADAAPDDVFAAIIHSLESWAEQQRRQSA